ncbi:hypothetical protein OS493_011419 [Desmophyllum pertusum]|uniref:RRM domain-containing protein n=1 Tax=Desmophyllum pertusum TaxID=174260 RepID=A0A9X0CLL5_9CNID|nr:hypothetical protein OS493_011419 [Desmophyllum pertusum]
MAYVPTEAVAVSGTNSAGDQASSLIKIPYRIFVGGIAFNTTKDELKEFFSRYGAVRDTKIIRDGEGLSKGYGFVTFYREEDAQKVMNMGTIFFKEKRLNISEAFRKQPPVAKQQALYAASSDPFDLQALMSALPVAAPTTWPSSATPVYYTTAPTGDGILTTMNQVSLRMTLRGRQHVYKPPAAP